MTLELINPEELPTPANYTQVIAATGSRLVFVAGQVADDAQGNLVGVGDIADQARQAFANVGHALAAAGAGPEQVTRITIYVVHHRPEYLADISIARIAVFGDHKPADTLDAHVVTLRELLDIDGRPIQLRVPIFQRSYEWRIVTTYASSSATLPTDGQSRQIALFPGNVRARRRAGRRRGRPAHASPCLASSCRRGSG